jgi:hypothetical protein
VISEGIEHADRLRALTRENKGEIHINSIEKRFVQAGDSL